MNRRTALALATVAGLAFTGGLAAAEEYKVGVLLPFSGRAVRGCRVAISFLGNTWTTSADDHGAWQIDVGPLEAGGPDTFTIRADCTAHLCLPLRIEPAVAIETQKDCEWNPCGHPRVGDLTRLTVLHDKAASIGEIEISSDGGALAEAVSALRSRQPLAPREGRSGRSGASPSSSSSESESMSSQSLPSSSENGEASAAAMRARCRRMCSASSFSRRRFAPRASSTRRM